MAGGEQGYEARVMPQAGAPLPMASARTYGAELADTVGQVAQDVHQREIRAQQARRQLTADREASDFAHKYALHRQAMDDTVRNLRASPTSADYADHVQSAVKADQDAREQLLAGITEDSVRRRAEAQLDDYRTRLVGNEAEFAEGQRVAKTFVDARSVMEIGANRVRRAQSAGDYTGELKDWGSYVDGLQGLTPVQKQKLQREGTETYTVAFVNHLNDTNPAAAIAMLDAGTFDGALSPQQVEQLRNGSQVELRRAQAQQAEQQRAQVAQFRETVATVKSEIERGIDHTADLPGLVQQAQAYGDTSMASELTGLGETVVYMKVWGARSPLAREQRISELQAIPEGKRTQAQQVELKQQLDHKSALDSAFKADPVEWAQAHAGPSGAPPVIENWSRDELASRERWMKGAAAAYGTMQPLTGAEVAMLQDRANSNETGYRAVLSTVSQFSPAVASQAMRQIRPSDQFAQHLVALDPNTQKLALEGRAAQKANSAILHFQRGADGKEDADVKASVQGLRAGLTGALINLPGDQRNGVLEVADAIAANSLLQQGKLSDGLNSSVMAWAMDRALGAQGTGAAKRGGLGWWGGKIYLLPNGVTQSGFEQHVTGYLRYHPENLPVNPDGSLVDLRQAKPQALDGNRYQFVIGNRVVLGKDGKPWIRTVVPK